MPQPYDYSLNVPNPTQNLLGTLGVAQGVSGLRASQAAAQEAELSLLERKEVQRDLALLSENASPSDITKMMIKHPELSTHLKSAHDSLSEERKQTAVSQASQVYAALHSGNNDIAKELLEEQASAYENSGQAEEAKRARDIGSWIEMSPESAKTSVGLYLASAMGPEHFSKTFGELESNQREADLHSGKLTKQQYEIDKAAVDSKFAESNAVTDLAKKGWEISKLQSDIELNGFNKKIALMNAKSKTTTDDVKKKELELKIEKAKETRDAKVLEKADNLTTARFTIDNMLTSVDEALSYDDDVFDDVTGPIDSVSPTLGDDEADLEETIKAIDAQAFLSQVPQMKGLGALTEAEGKKLTLALKNLSLRQSSTKLKSNLRSVQELMLKARTNLAKRYGMPDNIPDRPALDVQPNESGNSGDSLPPANTSGYKVLGV